MGQHWGTSLGLAHTSPTAWLAIMKLCTGPGPPSGPPHPPTHTQTETTQPTQTPQTTLPTQTTRTTHTTQPPPPTPPTTTTTTTTTNHPPQQPPPARAAAEATRAATPLWDAAAAATTAAWTSALLSGWAACSRPTWLDSAMGRAPPPASPYAQNPSAHPGHRLTTLATSFCQAVFQRRRRALADPASGFAARVRDIQPPAPNRRPTTSSSTGPPLPSPGSCGLPKSPAPGLRYGPSASPRAGGLSRAGDCVSLPTL